MTPTLPLTDVPGYRPDGVVLVRFYGRDVPEMPSGFDELRRIHKGAMLVLDPTGLRSLATAIGDACGLDVSRGVTWWRDSIGLAIETGGGQRLRWLPSDVPALSTIDPTSPTARAEALAAVARVVLAGVARG